MSKRLTVCMIVRNAEPTVAAALESVRSIADEIVVLDTGSTDRTCEIAATLANRFVQRAWDHDFAAARNRCWEYASGDWILWLDAGERLSAESATALRAALDRPADCESDGGLDTNSAFLIPVCLPVMGDELSAEQAARIRLVPNRNGLRFSGRVREQLHPALAQLGMNIQLLSGCTIDRDPHDQLPEIKAGCARRTLRLADIEIREFGPDARTLLAMGEAFLALEEHAKAADTLRRAILVAQHGSTQMLEAYYSLLTTFDGFPEQREAQVAVCIEALEIFPRDAQLLCALGTYLQNFQQFDMASRTFESAYQHGQINPETWHLARIREVAALSLAIAYRGLGRDDLARQRLIEITERGSSSLRVRRLLAELSGWCPEPTSESHTIEPAHSEASSARVSPAGQTGKNADRPSRWQRVDSAEDLGGAVVADLLANLASH